MSESGRVRDVRHRVWENVFDGDTSLYWTDGVWSFKESSGREQGRILSSGSIVHAGDLSLHLLLGDAEMYTWGPIYGCLKLREFS